MEDPSEKHNQSTLRTKQLDDNTDIQHLYSCLMRDESSAWNEFNDYFSGRIDYFFHIKRGVTNDADREDLFQQTLEGIFKSLSTYNPEQVPFTFWVYGVANKICLRYKEQKAKSTTTEFNDSLLDQITLEVDASPDKNGSRPSDPRWPMLKLALDRLSKNDQQILKLRTSRTSTWDELAEELGIKTGTARMRYNRALQRLKNAYDLVVTP